MKIKNNLKKIAALFLTFIMLVTGMFCVRNVKRVKAYDIAENFVLTDDILNKYMRATNSFYYERPAIYLIEHQLVDLNSTTIQHLRMLDAAVFIQCEGDTYYLLDSENTSLGLTYYDFSDPDDYAWLFSNLFYGTAYIYGMGIWRLDTDFYELMISLQDDFKNAYTSYSPVYPRISLLLRDPLITGECGLIVDCMYDPYNDIVIYQGEIVEWLD